MTLTKKQALQAAINAMNKEEESVKVDITTPSFVCSRSEVIELLEKMVAQLEKKNANLNGKPTARQIENLEKRTAVVEWIGDNYDGKPFLIQELIKKCPAFEGLTSQRVSPILTTALEEGELMLEMVKGKKAFKPYTEEV